VGNCVKASYGVRGIQSRERSGRVTPDLKRLLTVKDVVELTRLSKSTVYSLLQQRLLPGIQVPGCKRVLIDPEDLAKFLEAGKTAEASAVAALGTCRA
jgi:excisionase family DNA binding protein